MITKGFSSKTDLEEIDNNFNMQLTNLNIDNNTYLILKRLFDLFLSLTSIIIFSPIMLLIAILIKLESHGPIFVKQKRVGRFDKIIYIYKFRTIFIQYGKEDEVKSKKYKFEHKHNFTKVGGVLYKTSLDELPQLINIIKGDMSIVGPRPTIPFEMFEDNYYRKLRKMVKPGLTGLYQINKKIMSYEEIVKIDAEYVCKASLVMDLKIIVKTVLALINKYD